MTPRYVVRETGTPKRPFEVHDTKGTKSGLGWVVFCSASYQGAFKAADGIESRRPWRIRQPVCGHGGADMISLRQVCTALDRRSENALVIAPTPAGFEETQCMASDLLADAKGSFDQTYLATVCRAIRDGSADMVDNSGVWTFAVGDRYL